MRDAATAERRPLSNLIETAALARVRGDQFVDDVEMAEIVENDDRGRRVRVGSRHAREGQETFVA